MELTGSAILRIGASSVILISTVSQGCERSENSTGEWQGTMRDSAGVEIVQNPDIPLWSDGDGWTFTKLVRIGVSDGDPRYQFGSVSGLLLLSDGRVAVADRLAHNVRFYSADGEFLYATGKKGSGPGEFAGVIQLFLGPGDTVLAVDRQTQRGNRIGPDGMWLGSFSMLPQDGFYLWGLDDDGTSGEIVSMHRPMSGEARPADDSYSMVIRRDVYGAYRDTLVRLPASRSSTGSGDDRLRHFYRGGGDYDLCNGMFVTGHSDEHRFIWHRKDGSVARIATLDRPKMPITSEDQRLFFNSVDEAFSASGNMDEATDYKSRVRFEETYPAWRRFVCGPGGSILVQRNLPISDTYPEVSRGIRPLGGGWDAFDVDGRYLGLASLPTEPHRHAFAQLSSGEWAMLGIERDELDVEYISVWRVEGRDQF